MIDRQRSGRRTHRSGPGEVGGYVTAVRVVENVHVQESAELVQDDDAECRVRSHWRMPILPPRGLSLAVAV
jgi:hypothetical protein